jgi:hypothetical protein
MPTTTQIATEYWQKNIFFSINIFRYFRHSYSFRHICFNTVIIHLSFPHYAQYSSTIRTRLLNRRIGLCLRSVKEACNAISEQLNLTICDISTMGIIRYHGKSDHLGMCSNNHYSILKPVRSLCLPFSLLFVINTGPWRANRVTVRGHANCFLLF